MLIKIRYNSILQISSIYSIRNGLQKVPPQVSTPNFDLPKRWKMGLWRGGVTKPNSIMTSFEIDPAISNFELEYVVNYMLYENNAISVDEN